jgi:hypothetical protein
VQVDDVEALVPQGPDRPEGARQIGAMGATEPLAASGTHIPSGVTPPSGGGPSHGPSTRTSCPSARNDRARPSTWPCTPPGKLKL